MRYLNDVLNGENITILEMAEDLNFRDRFHSMIQDLNITEQTLDCCLKEIATVLLEDSANIGCLVSFLLFSIELDSFHSTYSAWYRRDMLIETLHNILLDYNFKSNIYKKSYYFWRSPIILLLAILCLFSFECMNII